MWRKDSPSFPNTDDMSGRVKTLSGIGKSSNGCLCLGSAPYDSRTYDAATSLAVLEDAQKNGGDSTQLICSADGTNISGGWHG